MSLPNADRAIVDPAKVRDYLLSVAHPVGRFKAAFFLSLATLKIDGKCCKATFLRLRGPESPYLGAPARTGASSISMVF